MTVPYLSPRNHFKQINASLSWRMLGGKPHRQETLDTLVRDGIVKCNWKDMGLPQHMLDELLTHSKNLKEQFQSSRFEDPLYQKVVPNSTVDKRDYWLRLLGNKLVEANAEDIFAQVALRPELLGLMNSYFRCFAWLMDYNVWLNVPNEKPKFSSQLWHRDTVYIGDNRFIEKTRPIIKILVYLGKVNVDNGALSFLKGSHDGGARRSYSPSADCVEEDNVARYVDQTVLRKFSSDDIFVANGDVGDIVIFDGSGLHCGGKVTQGERLLFKMQFGDWLWRAFPYPKLKVAPINGQPFSLAQKWAVSN